MAALLYHSFAFLSLFSYGLYHLISSTRSFFKPSSSGRSSPAAAGEHIARPYYPLPLPSSPLRHLPLSLSLLSLLISIAHHSFLPHSPNPFPSLRTAASLLLFLLIAISLPLPFPPALSFLLASLAFSLLSSSPSAFRSSDLQSKCDSISSAISAASAALSLALAAHPRLFLAELALAASLSLQGLWSLQTLLSLYVDAFLPDGCHRLLQLADGSVRCELEDSRQRAADLLDLAFALHAALMSVVVLAVYALASRAAGPRRCNGGSYEALPTSSSSPLSGGLADSDHVQMKAIAKNSTQA